jgi:hypothetical protein
VVPVIFFPALNLVLVSSFREALMELRASRRLLMACCRSLGG